MNLDQVKSDSKTVSFIIPMYNGKDFIINCVSRLKAVDFSKEILIVNDGSTDDSLVFCQTTFEQDGEIKIFSKENGGIASARNYGLEKASGEFVVFVDQDDQLVPEIVSKAIRLIETNNCQILFWDTQRILPTGQLVANTHSSSQKVVCHKDIVEKILPSFLYGKETDLECEIGPLWGALFCRKFVQDNNIKFKSYVAYEDDHVFLFKALLCADRVCFFPETGYYWVIRDESTSHKKRKKISDCVNKILEFNLYRFNEFKKICEDKSIVDEYKTYVEQFIIFWSISYVCTYYSWDMKEIRKIRALLYKKNYIAAFEKKLAVKNNFAKMLYPLLKRKHDILAFCLSYINSIRNGFR